VHLHHLVAHADPLDHERGKALKGIHADNSPRHVGTHSDDSDQHGDGGSG
jgi:hypothetical protein